VKWSQNRLEQASDIVNMEQISNASTCITGLALILDTYIHQSILTHFKTSIKNDTNNVLPQITTWCHILPIKNEGSNVNGVLQEIQKLQCVMTWKESPSNSALFAGLKWPGGKYTKMTSTFMWSGNEIM